MQQATLRDKKLAHLVETLPLLKTYIKGDQSYLSLTYDGKVVEAKVDDKLFNLAETDYHATTCRKLLDLLFNEIEVECVKPKEVVKKRKNTKDANKKTAPKVKRRRS